MASSSSSSSSSLSRTRRHRVFVSFHGQDVRKTFLSHLRKQFDYNGISMFDDQGIERGQTISPELMQAIGEARISIVVLSENYTSSSWCLKELEEILKCKKDLGQIVMTVFHGVDPSDVRNQTAKFGIAFDNMCACKTDDERRKWSQALTDVGNIAGEHFLNWVNEVEMIENIAKDVLHKLNFTPSRDFDGMVGIEAHLRKVMDLLDLDNDGVKMVAICGPTGIGKTTIARALYSKLSSSFQLSCFMENLRGSYNSGLDDYGLKLCLQEQFLSKVLNHNGLKIRHLGAIQENLSDQKVLIILDDVNNLNQLKALANEITWFGSRSRIVVTTENKELLQQHGIDNTYHVRFPSSEEAREILCGYAFKQSSPRYGFHKFFGKITQLCGNLPLALRVVGSSLCRKKEDEWEDVVNRLERILDREIEDVLRVGYESLEHDEQTLFLHIALFFNYKDSGHVKAMFADGNLDVKRGLRILVYRSLIEIHGGIIVMHILLRQMARQAIQRQKPRERKILMDADEICEVLENETGTREVMGILFDISGINEVPIGKRAFKKMANLWFLKVYKSREDGNDIMHIPEDMEFPRRLRLLDWEAYPRKRLPHTFHLENLVELRMHDSQLEYLWQGPQKLQNLKKMDLSGSFYLKELPDLSNATNLEELDLHHCKSLVEIPSSFSHLRKLKKLLMGNCINLRVLPPQLHLPSLKSLNISGCKRLTSLPDLSPTLYFLNAKDCESLQTILVPLARRPYMSLYFSNCFKLCQQVRRETIGRSLCPGWIILPGSRLPATFDQRATGNLLTIRPDGNYPFCAQSRIRICVVVSPNRHISEDNEVEQRYIHGTRIAQSVGCRQIGSLNRYIEYGDAIAYCRAPHLFMFDFDLHKLDQSGLTREIVLEFGCNVSSFDVIECGAYFWTKEKIEETKAFEDQTQLSLMRAMSCSYDDGTNGLICEQNIKQEENTYCWSWLFLCFTLSDVVKDIRSLVLGRGR